MKHRKAHSDLSEHHKQHLLPLVRHAPFVLRIGEKAKYPAPVLIVKERREIAEASSAKDQLPLPTEKPVKKPLSEVGYLAGDQQRRCLPILRKILAHVRDESDVPLELQRYMTQEGLKLRITLPLDEEAGAKLGLIFRLNARVRETDRAELIARRVAKFTREEAVYWLSRTTSFGADANRWALSGLRILLGGPPGDKGIEKMLDALREKTEN